MPAQSFKIDQAATFTGVALLSVEPKVQYGRSEQDRTTDGVPKWEVQVVAGFRGFGGRTNNEVIKIGMTCHTNPGDGINPYTPVELVDFEVGVMPDERKDKETGEKKIVGVKVWYRAREIRSTAATNGRRPGQSGE
jgi:hypothetical protein